MQKLPEKPPGNWDEALTLGDEKFATAHGKEHLFYLMQSTLRCNIFLKCHQNVNMRRISPKEISDKTKCDARKECTKQKWIELGGKV